MSHNHFKIHQFIKVHAMYLLIILAVCLVCTWTAKSLL